MTAGGDPESVAGSKVALVNNNNNGNYKLQIFQSSLNLLAHLLVGMITVICLFFAFRTGLPIGPIPVHIVLCVIGYQLLMAEGILSLTDDNGWSSRLRFVDKRRAHWILLLLGSGLAIAGSFIVIIDKTVNWNTLHGQFGLVALVFTTVSLVNGLTSLYAYEFRKVIPQNLSKLTHICFGTVAFIAANISLCYGFDKNSFRNWISAETAYTSIGFTAALSAIVMINPIITFIRKSKSVFS